MCRGVRPSPKTIIDGVVLALEKLKERQPDKETGTMVADLKKARIL